MARYCSHKEKMEWMQALRPLSIFQRPCGRVSPPAACSTHAFPGSKWICCICRLLLAAINSYCLAKYSLASWSFFILIFLFSFFFLQLKVPHTGGLRSRAGCPLPHLRVIYFTDFTQEPRTTAGGPCPGGCRAAAPPRTRETEKRRSGAATQPPGPPRLSAEAIHEMAASRGGRPRAGPRPGAM